MSESNGKGAVSYLRDHDDLDGLRSLVEGLDDEQRTLMTGVLEELYRSDRASLLSILAFLAELHASRPSIGSSLSEIVKFADLRHRAIIRMSLHDFPARTEEELTNPDVLTEAAVLNRWLRIYARVLSF